MARGSRGGRPGRAVVAVLVLVSLALLTLDRQGVDGPPGAVRDGLQTLTSPFVRLTGAALQPVGSALSGLGGADEEELERLREENAALRGEVRRSESDRRRAAELDALLRLPRPGTERRVPARVIGLGGASGFEQTATLDAGARDGVQEGQTVLDGDGLVGRVVQAGALTSTVLLVSDTTSGVGVRVEGTGEIGEVRGTGGDQLELRLFDTRAPVTQGDRLVSLGSAGSPFVPEVPVGVVTAVRAEPGSLLRTADVRPFADLSALDTVAVVVEATRDEPRQPLPEPPPTG